MTLREKAIEATFQAMGRAEVGDDEAVGRALARAALDAVLSLLAEPDEEMAEAGEDATFEAYGDGYLACMTDAFRAGAKAMIRKLQEV